MVVWTFASATVYSQRTSNCGSLDVCVCHIYHFSDGLCYWSKLLEKSHRQSPNFNPQKHSRLSFHPTAINPNKQLPNLLKKGLKGCKKIVVWHDIVNNSLSSHRSNGNRNCPSDVFLEVLEPFRNQTSEIIYNQRIGNPDMHKKLVEASYNTIERKDQRKLVKNYGNCNHWNVLNSTSCKSFYIIKTIFQSS